MGSSEEKEKTAIQSGDEPKPEYSFINVKQAEHTWHPQQS